MFKKDSYFREKVVPKYLLRKMMIKIYFLIKKMKKINYRKLFNLREIYQ